MEVELRIEPGLKEPKAVLLAESDTPEIRQLIQELAGLALGPVQVWKGDEMRLLPQGEFLRFYTDGKNVAAQTEQDVYQVGLRLYELEERLDRRRFVRISNSEIVNLDKVKALDLSLAGTIRMTLAEGTQVYVSRRCVKRIKEILQLGRRRI